MGVGGLLVLSIKLPNLAALYRQHADVLHKVAASVLREVGLQDEKGDVVQDAIVSLMDSPPTEEIRDWVPFLIRVVKNKAYDRIRAAGVRHFGRSFDVATDDRSDETDSALERVEEHIDAERAGAQVWDALATLDARERFIVREVAQNGKTQGAVAAELGISRGRVAQIFKEALTKLKTELGRKGE